MKVYLLIATVCLSHLISAQVYPGNMISITGGTFTMGNNNQPPMSDNQDPEHQVTLFDFDIGETEVTYAYYVQFLNAMAAQGKLAVEVGVPGDWASDSIDVANGESWNVIANTTNGEVWDQQVLIELTNIPGGGQDSLNRCWIEWDSVQNNYSVVPGYEDWPACWVSWYGAMMYCDYYNLSLPSEAEWEYAGKGGQDLEHATNDGNLSYAQANYGSFGTTTDPNYLPYPAPVATLFLPNPYGLYNMTGNVSEWCLDWYHPEFYQMCVDSSFVVNPLNEHYTNSVEVRILRGGNHTYPGAFATNTNRFDTPPFVTTDHMGFRVVRRSHILSVAGISSNEFRVYPNPVRDHLFIRNLKNKNVQIEIFDVNGMKVYSDNHNGNDRIDLSNFNNGVYLVHVDKHVFKVIKR